MILCCGEALIDMIPTPTNDGREGFVPHPGGAVFNTAIALGRLGASVGLLSGLSSDMLGRQLSDALEASNVNGSFVIRSDRPTTLAFVRLVDGQASYQFYDENSAGRMVALADMPLLPQEVSTLFCGGISLACEPCADAYAALVEREGAGRVVMLDPNIRPKFIEDEAPYRARLDRMIGAATIVKVSDEDLDWIMPGSQPLNDKVKTLLSKGPSLVVVTQGADGVTGFRANGAPVKISATPVQVADTVGAGDTFNAGLLANLATAGHLNETSLTTLSKTALQAALAFGALTAAATVSRPGANPPWADELKRHEG